MKQCSEDTNISDDLAASIFRLKHSYPTANLKSYTLTPYTMRIFLC